MARHAGLLPGLLVMTAACSSHIEFPKPGSAPPAEIVVKQTVSQQLAAAAAPAGAVSTASVPVEVRYLGSGGFLVRRGQAVLMTAPLFTNPFPLKHLCGVKASRKLIKAFVDDVNAVADQHPGSAFENDLKDVSVVLSGHAHYDHLLDVP